MRRYSAGTLTAEAASLGANVLVEAYLCTDMLFNVSHAGDEHQDLSFLTSSRWEQRIVEALVCVHIPRRSKDGHEMQSYERRSSDSLSRGRTRSLSSRIPLHGQEIVQQDGDETYPTQGRHM